MKLHQVDLNLLVALDALLRERSVTLAGKRIGLGQPAMSGVLSRLRDVFKDELLVRSGRSYHLTPGAEALAEPLQRALEAIQRTLDGTATFDPSTSQRRFRIAMSEHLMLWLLPQLIERVRQLAPGVRVHAQLSTPEAAGRLAARRLDLSIQPTNLVRGTESQRLLEDRWVCAVWRGNTQVTARITREQLASMPHASFAATRVPLAEQLLGAALGKPPIVQVTTSSFVSLPFLLRGTELIALIQSSLAERVQALAEIRLLDLPLEIPELTYEMSWNRIFTVDPAHTWLRGVVADVARTPC